MKIHLTAIGGTGMGSLAGLLVEAGHEVRGSDGAIYPPMSTLLAELKIPLFEGYAAENLAWGPEVLVLGNTCRSDNVEHQAARARELRVVSFPQMLDELVLAQRHSVVVAGTHGKTTTSSIATTVLHHAGRAPGFLIGGVPLGFGRGFSIGQPPYFVVEGDEYDSACFDKRPKFVHYSPKTAILTGVEFDHADIYADLDAVKAAFAMLIDAMPEDGTLLVAADSEVALELCEDAKATVERYVAIPEGAAAPAADWIGRYRPTTPGSQALVIEHGGEAWATIEIPLTGAHNMANCLGVAAATASMGLSADEIAAGLSSFAGVKRRQEIKGVVDGVTVIDDFAHHPTAILQTLEGLRSAHGDGRVIAVFEPRSSTCRRNIFQQQFVDALAAADVAIVAPLFAPEKIPEAERLDRGLLEALRARDVEAHGPADVDEIIALLAGISRPGDLVVIMSSGGFDGLPNRLVGALEKNA